MSPLPRYSAPLGLVLLAGCAGGGTGSVASPPALHDGSLVLTDAVVTSGTSAVSFGRAVAVVDFDDDGLLDIAMANAGMANTFYRQLPDHTYEEVSTAWGLVPDDRAHWGLVAADFDNDGDEDLFVACGGFKYDEPNQLLRNDLATLGVMTDVSATSGHADWPGSHFSATALDHDNDGNLDLFVTDGIQTGSNIFLHNNGDGTFTQAAKALGFSGVGTYLCSSSGDFDNDGWPDVATSHFTFGPELWRNDGDGTFTDVADAMGVSSNAKNFGLVLEDFDNDGWLDLFLPKYDKEGTTFQSRIYMNKSGAGFLDATDIAGLPMTTAMGHNTGDIDGNGYPDILIGTGSPESDAFDVLILTDVEDDGTPVMEDGSVASGITASGPTRSHGMGIGDLDGDGDVDVYFNNGGPQEMPETIEENSLWLSAGNDNRWTSFDLEGVASNRSAIGAHIRAVTTSGAEVHRYKRAGHGFGNTNSPLQHVAIGADDAVVEAWIGWPSGIEQLVVAPEMSALNTVVETGLLAALEHPGRGPCRPRGRALGRPAGERAIGGGRVGERALAAARAGAAGGGGAAGRAWPSDDRGGAA